MSNIIIETEGLGKSYMVGHQSEGKQYVALRDVLTNKGKEIWSKIKNPQYYTHQNVEEFWALKNVSIEIKEGEVYGIIGPNGSGKTTLLKLLSRITEPTTGRAVIRGKVASLLEVGTGFHPELTGRENIFLNGSILGMSRQEIKDKFDEIVDFSGVEPFLDTPVKRFSSGMYVRLAFAVAAHLEPEILLVDEVLAVGDIDFQNKCILKMDSLSHGGRTVLIVSHNMNSIQRLCKKSFLLEKGEIVKSGSTQNVIEDYYNRTGMGENTFVYKGDDDNKTVQIKNIELLDHNHNQTNTLDRAYPFRVNIEFWVKRPVKNMSVIFTLKTLSNIMVCQSFNIDYEPNNDGTYESGIYVSSVQFPGALLNAGRYSFYIWLGSRRVQYDYEPDKYFFISESGQAPSSQRSKHYEKLILDPSLNWQTDLVNNP